MAGNDNKSLTFSTKVDSKSLKDLGGSLKDLKNISDNLKKSFDSMSKSLNFTQQTKDLKGFKSAIDDTLRAVNAALPALTRYAAASKLLGGSGGGSGPSAPPGASPMPAGGGGGRGGGGGKQILPAPGGGYFTPMNKNDSQGLALAGNIMGVVGQGFGVYQSWKTQPLQNFAATQQFGGGVLNRAYQGDLLDAFVLQRNKGAAATRIGQAGGQGAMKFGAFADAAGGILRGASSGNPGVLAGSIGGGIKDTLMNTAGGGFAAKEAGSLGSALEAGRQSSPMEALLVQHALGTSRMRMDLSRSLHGKDLEATGIGAGYGYSDSESAGFYTSGANRFGASAIMGGYSGGDGGQAGFVGTIAKQRDEFTGARMGQNGYIYDPGSGRGGGAGGQNYVGIGQRAMGLAEYGYNKENMLGALGNLQMGIGGDKNIAGDQAYKKLESVFRKAFAGGVVDAQLSEKIGLAVADHAFGSGGKSLSPESFGYAATAGLNKNSSARDIENRLSGAAMIGAGSQSNPIFRGIELESLKKSMGKNYDITTGLAFANTDTDQLLSGGSQELKDAVPDDASRNKYIQTSLNSRFQAPLAMLMRNNKKFQRLVKSSGGLQPAMANNPEARHIAARSLDVTKQFGNDYGKADAGLQTWGNAGVGAGDQSGAVGEQNGGLYKDIEVNKANQRQQAAEEVVRNAEKFINAIALQAQVFEKVGMQEGNQEAAVNTMKALEELVKTIQNDPSTTAKVQKTTDLLKKNKAQ